MKVQFEADLTSIRDYFDGELDLGFRINRKVDVAPLCHKRVRVTIEEIPDHKVPIISTMPQMVAV